jgi:hypothetical protein
MANHLRYALLLTTLLIAVPHAAEAVTRAVSASSDCTGGEATSVYSTISAAVAASSPSGDTIAVCDGTYVEQIVIANFSDLTISAFTAGQATVKPPAGTVGAVILVDNSASVFVEGLVIDGGGLFDLNCHSGDNRITGIRYRNSSGKVSNNDILRIKHASASHHGCQEGTGVWVSVDNGVSSVLVQYNVINDFQKNGVTVNGVGASGVVANNQIAGFGQTLQIAQNGIQFGFGATGEARANVIQNNYYNGATWSATALLLFDVDANAVKHSMNKFRGNQNNLSVTTAAGCSNIFGGFYDTFGLCLY